ncbi:ABC transporter permease [Butyricimonas paravirosa]
MSVLGFLLQKEFIQIFRDKTILLILFLITAILLLVLPPAAKVETSEIALSVVDHDRTRTSHSFIRKLTCSDHFVVGAYVNSYEEGLAAMERNETSGVLEIPKGFEKNVMERTLAPMMLEIDAVNGVLAGITSYYFLQILQQYVWEYVDGFGFQPGFRLESQEEILARVEAEAQKAMMTRARTEAESKTAQAVMMAQVQAEAEMQAAMEAEAAMRKAETGVLANVNYGGEQGSGESLPPLMLNIRVPQVDIPHLEKAGDENFGRVNMMVNNRYNPDGESKLYQIPSILAILVCIIGAVLSALNIVTEKESGTIEQMNVSPVKRGYFILSKIIPFWVIGMVILTIGLVIVWMLYDVVPRGSYGSIYVVSFLFLVSMVGFGVLISTACRNQQQAMLLCFFFLLIICLLCGMWTPIDSMPVWARIIADINPLRYYVSSMRLIFAYGSGLRHLLPQIGMLCVFIAVFNTWAVWNFRKAR